MKDITIINPSKEFILSNMTRYEFWNISSSGLREGKVDLFAVNDEDLQFPTVNELNLALVGNSLETILQNEGISKYLSRLGLAQTKTISTMTIPWKEVEMLSEKTVCSNGTTFCFTDGCGVISAATANQVALCLHKLHNPTDVLADEVYIPSVFQVRKLCFIVK